MYRDLVIWFQWLVYDDVLSYDQAQNQFEQFLK